MKAFLRSRLALFKREIAVYQRVIRDPRCPWLARLCLVCAVAYALSPIDIIPHFIPVLGYLDDAILLPLLVWLALRLAPKPLVAEIRAEVTRREGA